MWQPNAVTAEIETVVQCLPQSTLSEIRMDANEMDVGLFRDNLRDKPDNKANYLAVALSNETCVPKMHEKELGQHVSHSAATPPFINDSDDRLIVNRFHMADYRLTH